MPLATTIYETRLDLAAEVLHRFGEVRFIAHGSSMIPSIYPGDLLTVRSDAVNCQALTVTNAQPIAVPDCTVIGKELGYQSAKPERCHAGQDRMAEGIGAK